MNYLEKLLQGAPVEWKTLGELGNFYGGLTGKSKKDFEQGNAKYITYMNVFTNIATDLDSENWVKVGDEERQNKIAYKDILFTGSSETPNECGMTSVVNQPIAEDIYLNSFCFGFRFDSEFIDIFDPDFLKYLFRGNLLRREITRTANGVTRFNISKKKMEKIKIPIPPLSVQKEIARILDALTALTSELTSELTLRQKQYQYYRDKLLTFGDEVEWKTLGDIGQVKMCKRILKKDTSPDGEIPFYKIGTFGKKADAFISRKLYEDYKEKYSFPKKGDILISASGTIGRTVIYDGEPAYFQDSNIVWIDNNEKIVLNKFLWHLYKVIKWSVAEGGTINRLYNDNIRKIKIPIPPIEEQKRIAAILDKFHTLTSSLSDGLPKEIELRQKQYEYYRDLLLGFGK
ncbi:restriction endonuclease subunit S [Gallibacterium anatis]|uniref:restriction endonuclease subunit S n=1 Tax=Gallibacterium anatis TaxID=750 RepID=UPI003003EC83